MPALVEKHGGRYRVLGGEVETLEGDWSYQALVISEWSFMDEAECLFSRYQKISLKTAC